MPGPSIDDVGEDGLLARLFPLLPTGARTLLGPGDDAAVVAAPDGRVVVTTDVLVEGRHFRLDWSDGEAVGWRAAVQNLADVAAMGAHPTALVVALVVPPGLEVAWAEGLARGLAAACPAGVGVVGGDLSGGEVVVVSVTALGDLAGAAPVRRDGARPGDVVAHAGVAGWSAAGLAWLTAHGSVGVEVGDEPGSVPAAEAAALAVRRYRRPTSPLAAGPAAGAAGATAMLDVSDGLLRDAGRLARASGVVVDLAPPEQGFGDDLAALAPLATALGADARAWVLAGGEDHGLLATFPPGAVLPAPFRAVGVVQPAGAAAGTSGAAGALPAGAVTVGGVVPRGPVGWDHFTGADAG